MSARAARARARARVYDEILATERDYVRDLKLLIDAYVRPLQRDADGSYRRPAGRQPVGHQ